MLNSMSRCACWRLVITFLIAFWGAAFLTVAQAKCESVKVAVLPFEVREDFTKTTAELAAAFSRGDTLLGAVVVKATFDVQGCVVMAGYADPVLYVGANLRRNGCAFEHVLTHEREHVRLYREALATLEARILARAGEPDLRAAVEQEVSRVYDAHRRHDSPEEYGRNVKVCRGAIVALAGLR